MITADRLSTIAIAGASGRMGREVIHLAVAEGMGIAGAWVSAESQYMDQTPVAGLPGLRYSRLGHIDERPDIVVDFSRADVFETVLEWCRRERVGLVSGTTGLDPRHHAALAEAAREIPVLWSANFSLGIAVLTRAIAEAARALPAWDAEIVESHHAGKRDAPSGTALALGKAVAEARSQAFDAQAVFDRHGNRIRREGEIGFAVVRAGDIVGEHCVVLAAPGERLELGHRASDRAIFARGALHAARWLADRPAGLYRLNDCLE